MSNGTYREVSSAASDSGACRQRFYGTGMRRKFELRAAYHLAPDRSKAADRPAPWACGKCLVPVSLRRVSARLLYRSSRERGGAFPAGAGKACSGRYSSKLDRNCVSHSRCQDEPGRTAETQG